MLEQAAEHRTYITSSSTRIIWHYQYPGPAMAVGNATAEWKKKYKKKIIVYANHSLLIEIE